MFLCIFYINKTTNKQTVTFILIIITMFFFKAKSLNTPVYLITLSRQK